MAVPTVITDLSATAASNSPAGSDSIGTSLDDYLRVIQSFERILFDTATIYSSTVGGTADVITLTPTPALTAYKAGQGLAWIASGANTTNVTANASGLGAKAVTKNGSTALVAGDIPSGALVYAIYDGTRLQLQGVFTAPATTLTGAVTGTGTGTVATTLATQTGNSVLAESTGSTASPTALAMGVSTILARLAAGNIVAATPTQISTLINNNICAKYTYDVASGTAGGGSTATAWTTRPINTEVYDDIGITLSSNAITVPVGTYYMTARMLFFSTASGNITTKGRIRNTTDSTDVGFFETSGGFADGATFSANYGLDVIKEKVVVSGGSKVFELQYYTSNAQATTGLGQAYSAPGTIERYTQWIIEKVA